MADDKHFQRLGRGVENWNQWRIEHPEIKPDLSGAQLGGAELIRVDLIDANLSGANLSGANLLGAYFGNADLRCTNLSSANLCGASFKDAKLMWADFHKAELRGANLDSANLNGTNLNEANLCGASFRGAKLRDADLRKTELSGANLTGTLLINANLTGTNLSKAEIIDTNFINTNLSGANFRRAVTYGTAFINVDLREVEGLETVIHWWHSEISASSLSQSKGMIPEAFLRGCGFRDWEIEVVKLYRSDLSTVQITEIIYKINELRSDPLIQFYSCFISYSHADKTFARQLHDTLQSRGVRCWLDEHQVLPGQDIYDEIDRGIRFSDKVLLCCSKHSLTSWWVDNEINAAFDKEQMLMRKQGRKVTVLIPLNIDSYLFSDKWKSGKASQIKSRLAADFIGWNRTHQKFERQLERVVKALRIAEG
jgi:uncharacterized protein YjbI with pentapeptide repeats